MVLVPCGCLSDKMDAAAWEEAVARARKAVLARLKSDLGESAEHHLHRRNGSNDTSEPRGVDGDECPATGIVDLEQHIKFEERMTLSEAKADDFTDTKDYVDFIQAKLKNVNIKIIK